MTRVTRAAALTLCSMTLGAMIGSAAQIDSRAVEFITPENIKWVRNAAGTNETAVLFGDPEKPGPYVIRLRWLPGNMSRPHYHQNDRFFVVVSGTWWVCSGEKYDPESTVPGGSGSYGVPKAGAILKDGVNK